MPAHDSEGQFKFLLACIKHSVAGKINFEAVSHELGIVSKAAAAKRYERLLKAHGIGVGGAPRGGGDGGGRSGRGAPPAPKSAKPSRKRKATKREDDDDDDDDDDDEIAIKEEEEYGNVSKKTKVVSALEDEENEWDDPIEP